MVKPLATSFALAIDVGGTKIAAARVRGDGQIMGRADADTPLQGGKFVVKAVSALARNVGPEGIAVIGVCVPGLAYPDGSVWAPNLPGWTRVPLGRMLEDEFGVPVVVDSDRNAFVVGEAWCGAARACDDVVFLAIGTGIGAGIISGGQLIRGYGGLSGALGWMAVESSVPAGLEDDYKKVGCVESHLAGPSIAREATNVFGKITSTRQLIRLANEGDPKALEVLARAGHYLGLVAANIVSTLNPALIVVGGGMAAAGDLLLEPARATMRRWGQPIAVQQVDVVCSRLGVDASLLGAAKLAFGRMGLKGPYTTAA